MSIDGIGKRPGPTGTTSGAGPREVASREAFVVERTSEAAPVAPVSAIARVRAGELSVEAYLDAKVEQATAHLGALPASQRDAIRETLRAQLATDPLLSDLVRAATGSAPPLPED